MKYINSFELLEEYNTIKPFKIEFKEGINIVVGDNGCGKSTLLQMLSKQIERGCNYNINLTEETEKNGTRFMYFDTEKMNPRISDVQYVPQGMGLYTIASHFRSHGEALLPLILHIKKENNKVLLIDEPESGISLKNQIKIHKALKKAEKNNNQIIVTTHSYILIKSVKEIYDLENRCWISSKEYLKNLKVL